MSYQSEVLLIYVFFLFTLISYLSNIVRNEKKEEEIVIIFVKSKDYYIETQNIKRINIESNEKIN
jgi:hypothetical protein